MCDDIFLREESSDLSILIAGRARRNTHLQLYLLANAATAWYECGRVWSCCRCLFLLARCNENKFGLSSSGKDVSVSLSFRTICMNQQQIRSQGLEIRLVSKFGIEMSSFQKFLGQDTIFVHDCNETVTIMMN